MSAASMGAELQGQGEDDAAHPANDGPGDDDDQYFQSADAPHRRLESGQEIGVAFGADGFVRAERRRSLLGTAARFFGLECVHARSLLADEGRAWLRPAHGLSNSMLMLARAVLALADETI